MQSFNSQSLIDRMVGVARLDSHTFEEIERDRGANVEALIVVTLASIAAGIGTLNSDGITGLIAGLIGGVLGWIVYSIAAYFVADRLFPSEGTQTDPGELLRTLGYANTPRLLFVVGFIPFLGGAVSLVAFLWWITASILALRQSLEMTTSRAVIVGLIALIPFAIVMLIYYWLFGISPPGRS
jgi:hypothetical protein